MTADPSSRKNLKEFKQSKEKDTIHLLFAIDMLNEGLHIADVGAVILLRPTESPIIFYQQIGRCIQVDAAHTPLIFDFVNNFQNIRANDFLEDIKDASATQNSKRKALDLPEQDFDLRIIDETKDILNVFESISERITPWEIGLEHLKTYVQKHGNARVPNRHKTSSGFRLGAWVNSRRQDYKNSKLPQDKIAQLSALTGWTWDPLETDFQEGLEHLKRYVDDHGNARVPFHYETPSGFRLGAWVSNRRQDYKNSKLPQDKIAQLSALTGWTWDPLETDFQEGLEHLKTYVQKHGNARVPGGFETSSGFRLGAWVSRKRRGYKNNKLSQDKIVQLAELPGWTWDSLETDFQEGLEHLKTYVQKHGNARVPVCYETPSGFRLGKWVSHRRQDYKNSKLPQDKIAQLAALTGWTWDPLETDFQEGLEHLKRYVDDHGNARVPNRYKTPSGFRLGAWVSSRRQDYKNSKLPQDKIAQLAALTGWTWDPLETDFQEGLEHLETYVQKHGNARVYRHYKSPSGFQLGGWVNNRRKDYKNSKLPQDKIAQLAALTGWTWDPLETDFQEGLEHLKTYVQKHGNARVPGGYETSSGFRLGRWVSSRRQDYKNSKLPQDKIAQLAALTGWTWNPLETDFQEGLEHHKRYVDDHGNARVPNRHKTPSGFQLGAWVNSRRQDYKNSKLPQDKIAQLAALTGWTWNPLETDFQEGLEHLETYVQKYGNARVPFHYETPSGFRLGRWVSHRRQDYKNSKLPQDKIAQLAALTGWTWNPLETDFQEGLEHLKRYVDDHGNARVPSRHKTPSGFQLGTWVSHRRKDYKNSKLPQDKIAQLAALTGWTWSMKRG